MLGSATPSLESYHNAQNGRYELLDARAARPRSAAGRRADRRHARGVRRGRAGRDPQRAARARRWRRGSSAASRRSCCSTAAASRPSVFCRQCGSTLECPNCSVSLTVHRAARRARCHYCNHSMPAAARPASSAPGRILEQIGFGTERVEAEIARAFSRRARRPRGSRHDPAARRDRRAAGDASRRGELDVLVGTQMIAKGHDFPQRHAGRRDLRGRRPRAWRIFAPASGRSSC